MRLDFYPTTAVKDYIFFEFNSVGKNGIIPKIIQFQDMETAGLFNLAFGDKDIITGELNDLGVSNNGDTEKVLATVVNSLYSFFDHYPHSIVHIAGSTPSRTRLYQISISKYYKEMINDFIVFGETEIDWQPFELNRRYSSFLVQRKIS